MKQDRIPLVSILAILLLAVVCPLSGAESSDEYSPEELEEIVAPIALYPDVVLSSMLPASTFPTDVVQAARWVGEQEGEIGEPPTDAGWDPSVEALVQFPDVLVWMSENLDWMEMLAYAVSVQQSDVLQSVQDFRMKARDAGNLESNEQMQVIVESNDVIMIEPAQPSVVYVPTYDPYAVIRPGYTWPSFGAGFAMGAMGAWAWHSIGWGHNGGRATININNSPRYNFNNNGNINTGNIGSGNSWRSSNRITNRPSTNVDLRKNDFNRRKRDVKARPTREGVKPGRERPGRPPGSRPGDAKPPRPDRRPGGADRPGSGNQRPGGVDRPGGASRPSPPPRPPSAGNRPGAGQRPARPGQRPDGAKPSPRPAPPSPKTRPAPSKGSKSMMSGSSTNGRSAKQASSRGKKSVSSSRSRGSGGAARGGGGRGGARGGGGRRR